MLMKISAFPLYKKNTMLCRFLIALVPYYNQYMNITREPKLKICINHFILFFSRFFLKTSTSHIFHIRSPFYPIQIALEIFFSRSSLCGKLLAKMEAT
jgi:hypothetical protein